jgi:hypothetical protein
MKIVRESPGLCAGVEEEEIDDERSITSSISVYNNIVL